MAFSPDGRSVLTASDDRTAKLWSTADGRPLGEPLAHEHRVVAIAFSPDGRLIVTGSWDKTARLWDAATARPRFAPLPIKARSMLSAFSPDGKTVVSGVRRRHGATLEHRHRPADR